MRAVVQRVSRACLRIDGQDVASIGQGLVAYVGIGPKDDEKSYDYILDKLTHLRVFEDEEGKMNRSVEDISGEILIVSNFTLYGDCRHGRRPGYSAGAPVEEARKLYQRFTEKAAAIGPYVRFGVFQADMKIEQVCDGPVTLLLDSEKLF